MMKHELKQTEEKLRLGWRNRGLVGSRLGRLRDRLISWHIGWLLDGSILERGVCFLVRLDCIPRSPDWVKLFKPNRILGCRGLWFD